MISYNLLLVLSLWWTTCLSLDVFDLSHDLHRGMLHYKEAEVFNQSSAKTMVKYSKYYREFCSWETAGTHLQAPNMENENKWKINEIPPNLLAAELFLIDSPNREVYKHDLVTFETNSERDITKGSIVVLKTGLSSSWGSRDYWKSSNQKSGFTKDACEYLISKSVAGVGIDAMNIVLDYRDNNCEVKLADSNIYILKNLANLKQLPKDNNLVLIGILNMQGAAASPARVIAIHDEDVIRFSNSIRISSLHFFLYILLTVFCLCIW